MDHGTLARSFLTSGVDYDRYRPSFPPEAVDLVLPETVAAVLDLGAGTGKLTESLVARTNELTAVDPSAQMLDVLRAKLPTVHARVGSAEQIPVASASQDVVTVAQAFHWFDTAPACAEIARVLRPGGLLALLWNGPAAECEWDQDCHRIAHPEVAGDGGAEPAGPASLSGFEVLHGSHVPWQEQLTREHYLHRWLTVSTFLAAEPDQRAGLLAQVRAVLAAHRDTAGREVLVLPQATTVHLYRSVA